MNKDYERHFSEIKLENGELYVKRTSNQKWYKAIYLYHKILFIIDNWNHDALSLTIYKKEIYHLENFFKKYKIQKPKKGLDTN